MKIVVMEMGWVKPTDTPDMQSGVVEFEGSFEEYKTLERQKVKETEKDIEITDVLESLDGSLIVDYVSHKAELPRSIRQFHFAPCQLNDEIGIRETESPLDAPKSAIERHNEIAEKIEVMRNEMRELTGDYMALRDDVFHEFESMSPKEQVELIGNMPDSEVTFQLFHRLKQKIEQE